MKAKKAKEQFIGLVILSSVFVFFLYLKMNPEINVSSNNGNNINKIIEQKVQEAQIETTDSQTEQIAEEDIKRRLTRAKYEMEAKSEFDAIVINGDIDTAVCKLKKLIKT